MVLTDIKLTIGKEVTKYVGNDKFDLDLCKSYDHYHGLYNVRNPVKF
ncbi:hypothetical protein MHYMCMPSP_00238 [Hyalomma marginatum]|uniref:Uncharacterized protein n=1 Tax=Hyalomma marginatum TaxID=34627 RepID=A0A8S4C355_9ACAR|nr:hypothetical protein MHYMCMPSP_00238 [Hyalomma marginatum]CAG7599861.1 hypothetical protein MHYMCMPASI_01134 [Hyalomma marginatum]